MKQSRMHKTRVKQDHSINALGRADKLRYKPILECMRAHEAPLAGVGRKNTFLVRTQRPQLRMYGARVQQDQNTFLAISQW